MELESVTLHTSDPTPVHTPVHITSTVSEGSRYGRGLDGSDVHRAPADKFSRHLVVRAPGRAFGGSGAVRAAVMQLRWVWGIV